MRNGGLMSTQEIRNIVIACIMSFVLGALSVWMVVEPNYREEITALEIQVEGMRIARDMDSERIFYMMADQIDSLMVAHPWVRDRKKVCDK